MSSIFGTNRGCVVRLKIDTSGGQGASLSPGVADLENSMVIIGFNTRKEESVAIVKCFNDNSFIYAFGDNLEQSALGVKAVCFIGGDVKQNGSFANVNYFYDQQRLSKYPGAPMYFYYGASTNIPCYLIGMDSATVSVDYGMQEINFRFIMLRGKFGSGGKGAVFEKQL